MRLEDITEDTITEARMVWRRSGSKIKRAAPINMKKRMTLKKTKARMGKRLSRKSQRTKRLNPASRRLRTLNRR